MYLLYKKVNAFISFPFSRYIIHCFKRVNFDFLKKFNDLVIFLFLVL